jgi:lipopolysaccharide export system protein LptA
MIKSLLRILFFSFLFVALTNAQNNDYIEVKGDSLVGKTINGEMVREVHGNVVITQGNVLINCQHAIQYISRNEAELIGNVVIHQDSMTITTQRGYYFGDTKKSVSDTSIKLDDGKVVLTAKRGKYNFDDHKAFFQDSVVMKDSISNLSSDSLTYFKDENRIVAVSNVAISDTANTIKADSLEHFRDTRITYADHNVQVINPENHITLFGEHLEDYPDKNYTLVNKQPLLMQVDTTYSQTENSQGEIDSTMKIDTLVIESKIMETFRDTANIFIATDSVKIVRGDFASVNNLTYYYRDEGKIITYKVSKTASQPYLWYENTQLTGDSVSINLEKNRIQSLDAFGNTFITSQNDYNPAKFDQTSGDTVHMYFDNSRLQKTKIRGSVFSIYFQYDLDTPNGLTRSSSQNALILFYNNKVDEIRLYGSPNSEYYPEELIKGKLDSFVLAKFVSFKSKPEKEELLKVLKK